MTGSGKPIYLHLPPNSPMPEVRNEPFLAIVAVESDVSNEWRGRVSNWLVDSGCLYMCAWGDECSLWDDSVDMANLEKFDFGEITEDDFVMTTWHEEEPLEEALWFAKNCAFHPTIELEKTMIIHIADQPKEDELLQLFDQVGFKE